jgi:hypothetical protein
MRISTVPFSEFIHYEIIIFRNETGRTNISSTNPGTLVTPILVLIIARNQAVMHVHGEFLLYPLNFFDLPVTAWLP